MSLAETPSMSYLSGTPFPTVSTNAVCDEELITLSDPLQICRRAWNDIIDHYLIEWGRNPQALEDEDFDPPTPEVIARACDAAKQFGDEGMAAPLRVLPDGEGGLTFERSDGSFFESISIRPNCPAELLTFENCELAGRLELAV